MDYIVGVDACKGGWVGVRKHLASGSISSKVFSSGKELFSSWDSLEVLTIDIPIGLTEFGPRQCDLIARRMLGQPRGSSVFPAPIRAAVGASDRLEADSISRSIQGKGVGAQAFGIYHRIDEIDQIIRGNEAVLDFTYEVHPELCFMAWHGAPIQESKKSHDGMSIRRELISSRFGPDAIREVRDSHPSSQVADDDFHNAFAALWTADRINRGEAQAIPDEPEIDSIGIPMVMWF